MQSARPRWDHLIHQGLLSEAELRRVAAEAQEQQVDVEQVLLRQRKVPRERLGEALSVYYKCPYVPFDPRLPAPRALLRGIKPTYLRTNHFVPLAHKAGRVTVLIDDPSHLIKRDAVESLLGTTQIDYRVGLHEDIRAYIDAFFGAATSEQTQPPFRDDAEEGAVDEAALVDLLGEIVADACERGASDIHIEPAADERPITVRLRIDGVCAAQRALPARLRHGLVARLKAMADLDPGEKRLPQEGTLRLRAPGREPEVELRVNTLPTQGGIEDVVLHLMSTAAPLPLAALQLSAGNAEIVARLLARPQGLLLVAGPEGSGKTMTLHSMLQHLNQPERKIWTVEDPVEITQPGLRQVQVHRRIGLTYAGALRACLRADPDVVMIGELRDGETAALAIEAALGGHLVLAAVPAGGAAEAVGRLFDVDREGGLDPVNLAEVLLGVVAQRLVRRLCDKCKEPHAIAGPAAGGAAEDEGWQDLAAPTSLFRAKGCDACHGTGYRGRLALHEVMEVGPGLRRLVQRRRPATELREQALRDGMMTLRQDGLEKAAQGLTDLREVRGAA